MLHVLRSCPPPYRSICTRSFSTRAALCASRSNLDPEGRTPGFARRRRAASADTVRSAKSSSNPNPALHGNDKVSDALQASSEKDTNNLLAPVHVPNDRYGILRSDHPATSILANSSIVVQRQLEFMNVLMGFEQANRYVMMDSTGNHIGYLAERDHGIGNAVARQAFRTHRSFTTHVFDRSEREVLRFHRPFSWISSRIRVYDAIDPSNSSYSTSTALQGTSTGSIVNQTSAQVSSLPLADMRIIGEAQQYWAPLRRKYNLFLHRDLAQESKESANAQLTAGDLPLSNSTALEKVDPSNESHGFAQFAYVNEPFLSWDFSLLTADDKLIGSVNRNFAGFAREIFTDTGVYALRMDSAALAAEPKHLISHTAHQAGLARQDETPALGMTLDQRAVMLATAVSIDFDYFSRHSSAGGGAGWMPLWFPWGGAGAGEAGAAGGAAEAGAAGSAAEAGEVAAATKAAQEAAKGVGAGEGAIAGAGSLAGYEAMQRSREQSTQTPDASPQNQRDDDFWGGSGGPPSNGGSSGGGAGPQQPGDPGDGADDGGSIWDSLSDFFDDDG